MHSGYMAPEYIVHGQLTERADIYSYGVLVLEIITGRKNHNSVASSAEGLSLMALVGWVQKHMPHTPIYSTPLHYSTYEASGVHLLSVTVSFSNSDNLKQAPLLYVRCFVQIWRHYNAGTLMELLDPNLRDQCSQEQALQVFHVGLLCAQASPNLRPPMWKVVEMLSSKDHRVLPRPTQPPFINVRGSKARKTADGSSEPGSGSSPSLLLSSSDKSPFSLNQLSVSGVQAR